MFLCDVLTQQNYFKKFQLQLVFNKKREGGKEGKEGKEGRPHSEKVSYLKSL